MPAFPPQPEFCPPWDLTWEQATACEATPPEIDEEAQQQYLDEAAEWIWWRTGRRYSRCTTTIVRTLTNCQTHGWGCHCPGAGQRLDVPVGPIISIAEVTTGTDATIAVEGTDFEIVNRTTLRRLVGYWPRWSEIAVTVTYGQDPPAELLTAAGKWAVERARQCLGEECAFDENTETASAEGMTIRISRPDLYPLSGIRDVDRAITAYWPHATAMGPGASDPLDVGATGWDVVTPSEELS